VTGDVRIHEMAWVNDELWFVNTRFNCLCTIDASYSFVPQWQPSFVSASVPEDRCRLNGLAVADGKVLFATALGQCDAAGGWRADKARGGILIDVLSNQVITGDLSMPHSPRVYEDQLWLLDSGRGSLVKVDRASGRCDTVIELPGFTRGLAFFDRYAFVTLSKIREKKEFGGLPIEARRQDLQCAIYVVDLRTAEVAGFIEFTSGCTEIFDVQVLPGKQWPAVVGLQKDQIDHTFVVPSP